MAYDRTRVKLGNDANGDSDYINASYIPSTFGAPLFIAAQG